MGVSAFRAFLPTHGDTSRRSSFAGDPMLRAAFVLGGLSMCGEYVLASSFQSFLCLQEEAFELELRLL